VLRRRAEDLGPRKRAPAGSTVSARRRWEAGRGDALFAQSRERELFGRRLQQGHDVVPQNSHQDLQT
jgi:hypothetical protein